MQRVRTLCAAALLAVLCVLPALAQPDGPPPGGGPPHGGPPGGSPGGPRLEHALERVELPDDVRAKVDGLLDTSRANQRELRRALRQAHDRMRELLEEAEPSEDAVLQQAGEIGGLQTELEQERLRSLLRIRAELTPEQREAMTEALRPRRRDGRRPGHPPGGRAPQR